MGETLQTTEVQPHMANKEFVVERVLDKQVGRTDKIEDLLKWRGYPETTMTGSSQKPQL